MVACLSISILTVVGIVVSLFIKPYIKIGKISISLYWVIAFIGAVLLVCFGCISFTEIFEGVTASTAINPLKLLALFFSMTFLSIFLDEVGFFRFLVNWVLSRAKASQVKLFIFLYLIVSLLSVFTSNDIVILTFTPFILYFSKNAKINPIPFLVAEFVSANTLSMTLIIGNPTNIYLATSFGIDFLSYLKIMFIPSLLSSVAAFLILFLIFRKQLKTEIQLQTETVEIKSKFLVYVGIAHLFICIILLAVSSYLNLEMWYICLGFVGSLLVFVIIYLIVKRQSLKILWNVFKRLPFELIPFILSMFVIVLSLNNINFPEQICNFLGIDNTLWKYGALSFLSSNILNNIPMSVLFTEILTGLSGNALNAGLFASIIGSNIGAYLTPIGALAGIMWLRILKHNDVKFSFLDFFKYGVIVSIPVMLLSLCGLWLAFLIFM